MGLERQYTVPLRREFLKVPRYRRAKKATKFIKQFMARHMKTDEVNVKVGRWVNELVWERGIKNPPTKVRVNAVKDDKGIVKVELIELSEKAEKIEAKEAVRMKAAEEKKKKEDAEKKAQELAAKKHAEEEKKKQEAEKSKVEKEVDREKKDIEKVEKKVTEPVKDVKSVAPKEIGATKHQHPQRKVMNK